MKFIAPCFSWIRKLSFVNYIFLIVKVVSCTERNITAAKRARAISFLFYSIWFGTQGNRGCYVKELTIIPEIIFFLIDGCFSGVMNGII